MLKLKSDDIKKWRIEIDNAEDFKVKNWGDFKEKAGAGENIDYFEYGMSSKYLNTRKSELSLAQIVTINMIYPVVKNVIPTLYFKNPTVTAIPKRAVDEDTATYVSHILNFYMNELDLKEVNKEVIFNAYLLGFGVIKVGYTTKFGTYPTEENVKQEEKEQEKSKLDTLKELIGLKPKKKEETKANPELNEYIKSESPFVYSVNPFNFGIDPAATSIYNARYVYEKITRLLSDVKNDKNYSNTADLEGNIVEGVNEKDIPTIALDQFKTIDLYEIHYKTDKGINILTLAVDGEDERSIRHQESVYNIDGFQYEILSFNKHAHRLYPISDIEEVKELQNRINASMESILEQVDKYVPKLFVDETAMTESGKRNVEQGGIGAICFTNKNPNECVKEASFTQLKADMMVLIDRVSEAIMLTTGMTKAQMMGMTSAQTATEAQIGQSGSNLRASDKLDTVNDFVKKELSKLWQVIQQFVDLEQLEIITGEKGIDEVTGVYKFDWLPSIDSEKADKMYKGKYRFDVEMGSTEKPDLPILRKQVENIAMLLTGNGVLQAFEQQGYKIELAEFAKRYLQLFPNVFTNIAKIIKPIQQPMQQPMGMPAPQQGGARGMAQFSQLQSNPPNIADIASSAAGEKGQGAPLA